MRTFIHTFTCDPINQFLNEQSEGVYEVDTHIEEFVRDELLNTLKFIIAFHGAKLMPPKQKECSDMMNAFTELYKSSSWDVLFDSEVDFLAFLRTVCDLRNTYLNSLLYSLIKKGVSQDKARLALQELMVDYDISFIDLQHRQLTAPRY